MRSHGAFIVQAAGVDHGSLILLAADLAGDFFEEGFAEDAGELVGVGGGSFRVDCAKIASSQDR